jgi:hypothetical protein
MGIMMRTNILLPVVIMAISIGLAATTAEAKVIDVGNLLAEADRGNFSFGQDANDTSTTKISRIGNKTEIGTYLEPITSNAYPLKANDIEDLPDIYSDIELNNAASYGDKFGGDIQVVIKPLPDKPKPYAIILTGLGLVFLSVQRKNIDNG